MLVSPSLTFCSLGAEKAPALAALPLGPAPQSPQHTEASWGGETLEPLSDLEQITSHSLSFGFLLCKMGNITSKSGCENRMRYRREGPPNTGIQQRCFLGVRRALFGAVDGGAERPQTQGEYRG